jgi:hypothetical protein
MHDYKLPRVDLERLLGRKTQVIKSGMAEIP